MRGDRPARDRPLLLHVTTVDLSLDVLLRPQLEAFAAAGFEVVGVSAPGPYVADLEASGIRHIALEHATRSMDARRDLLLARELYRVFRRECPDIVHTHNPKTGWFGRLAARAARVPVVVNTVHGLYATPQDPRLRRTVVYALERAAAACSHAELLQSEEDLPVLRRLRVPADRLHVLGNGIDLDRFRVPSPASRAEARVRFGFRPDEVVVGAVGRLVWEKGLREILELARLLRSSHPQVVVVVAGPLDPDKGDGLSADALSLATAETGIRFVGEVRDIEQFYAALDCYVLASYREGFPRSAMEAAACGLPLVVTDIRGCRQVVDQGRNGLLVAVRDPAALADAVARLVDDAELRTAMGQASVAKAARDFDQQTVIDLTLATYHRLLRSGPTRS